MIADFEAPAPAVAEIIPRDVDFDLDPARATDWLGGSREKTLFLNALSILFPPGERFFISSVLAHRAKVADPQLKADVKNFVTQEGYHTREHIAYNRALNTILDADKLESELTEYLAWVKKTLPPGAPLLATCALEHFTAILAHDLLKNPEHLAGALPEYAKMWRWHALEECEHKAVAYDVFRAATGGLKEWQRMQVMALTTITFYRFIGKHCLALMRAQKMAKSPVSWAKLLWFVFGNPGIMRRTFKPYMRYYKSSFHPNDIDDSKELAVAKAEFAAWA